MDQGPLNGGAAVTVNDVVKRFDRGRFVALDRVSFDLAPGEFMTLTGPSGTGKSTLLNLIGALDRPDEGTIRVDGADVAAVDPAEYRARVVGFVFQFHNLIATLSARENVQVPLIGRGLGRREREQRARRLLDDVGLARQADSRPPTLSGGERQRVAIARALANDPRLLLADEPTGALDAGAAGEVLALLERVREERGTTILLVTNDEGVAARGDRTLRLRDGRVTPVATRRSAPS